MLYMFNAWMRSMLNTGVRGVVCVTIDSSPYILIIYFVRGWGTRVQAVAHFPWEDKACCGWYMEQ